MKLNELRCGERRDGERGRGLEEKDINFLPCDASQADENIGHLAHVAREGFSPMPDRIKLDLVSRTTGIKPLNLRF